MPIVDINDKSQSLCMRGWKWGVLLKCTVVHQTFQLIYTTRVCESEHKARQIEEQKFQP